MEAVYACVDDIREEYIRARLDGAPVTLKELAIQHGRSYAGLRKAASDGQWTQKAVAADLGRDAAVATQVARGNALTAALLEEAIGREVDVRRRHALLARQLQLIALERLSRVTLPDWPRNLPSKCSDSEFKLRETRWGSATRSLSCLTATNRVDN